MTLIIKVPDVTFAGPKIPQPDSVMPAAGCLLLTDPTHPAGAWKAGVPADGATVPNIGAAQARSAIGGVASLLPTIYNPGMPAGGKIERSGKGGVHVASKSTNTTAGQGFAVKLPDAIVTYLQQNPSHQFYWSLWANQTFGGQGASISWAAVQTSAGDTAMDMFAGTSPDGMGHATPNNLFSACYQTNASAPKAISATTGPWLRIVAGSPIPAAFATANPASVDRQTFQAGNIGFNNNGSTTRGKSGSRILYRCYLEDLTVSGRAAADVSVLDRAAFVDATFVPGGRYYGDTYTDPSTV